MQHHSVTSFADPPRLHPKNPDRYLSSNPLTWRKAKETTKKMGRTSHFPFSRKSVLPQTTNSHLIAEKPPPGQRPVTLSKAERILGTSGNINVDGGGGGRIGGQGGQWETYRMAGGTEEQQIYKTQSKENRPVSHADGSHYHRSREAEHDRVMDHMEEMKKTRSRLEDDPYHDNLRKERTRSIHSNHQSHQPSHQQWQNEDLGDLMPPRRPGLAARASSTLLGSNFKNEREGNRDLRHEKSSSTLRNYNDRSTAPPSTSKYAGRQQQLRQMESPVPDLPRSPHGNMNQHDVETLAAAEMRAATLREQMRRDGRRPEKKASRLNIGRLFGGKEKKRKDILVPEGFVLQDPRQMQHHQQHIESLERIMSTEVSHSASNGPSRHHAGVHDLYDHYESRAFDTAPSILEEETGDRSRRTHHVHYEDDARDQREEEVSPKAHHIAMQPHSSPQPQPIFSPSEQSHSHQTSSGDLHAFKFPAPTDPLATARQAKQKTKKPTMTSIFPAPCVPPNMDSHDLNLHSGVGGYPSQSQMKRLSGTPPSAPPNVAPPPPPNTSRKASGSGLAGHERDSEELQKGYAHRHWDNGSTHSSATGMSKSSKKSIFSSSNLAQNSVLSFSSDSDSDVEARFEEEKRRIKEQEYRPKTSDEKDRKDINGLSGRSKDHRRKRSSTISTPASQFSQDDKFLTIPLPSPISNRLSGPWQPPDLASRDKERDSGSTIRGGMSFIDKRLSSSTTASGVSMLSNSSAQSGMSQKSMHSNSNGNGRLSRANTLSSVAESHVQDSEHSMHVINTSALPSPPMPPPMGPVPPRPKRGESKSSQSKTAKSTKSNTPSAAHTIREASSSRRESNSEVRLERKQSSSGSSNRASGNFMKVTPQEEALLSALRNKRAKMRTDILAEAEAKEEKDMWGNEVGELNIKMQGFEFPAPPSEGRRGSAATINTITSVGAPTNPPRNRESSVQHSHSQRNASRVDSIRQRDSGSETPSRGNSRRAHIPQRQPSQQSKLSHHERAESDTLDGVDVRNSNSGSRTHSLTPNDRHPKANDEGRENALNGRLEVPPHHHTKTSTSAETAPSPDLSDFLSFGSDDDTPRSSWNNKQQQEEKKKVERERRHIAGLSALGPQKPWKVPLVIEDGIVEDDSFDDSEGEAILKEWGRGAM